MRVTNSGPNRALSSATRCCRCRRDELSVCKRCSDAFCYRWWCSTTSGKGSGSESRNSRVESSSKIYQRKIDRLRYRYREYCHRCFSSTLVSLSDLNLNTHEWQWKKGESHQKRYETFYIKIESTAKDIDCPIFPPAYVMNALPINYPPESEIDAQIYDLYNRFCHIRIDKYPFLASVSRAQCTFDYDAFQGYCLAQIIATVVRRRLLIELPLEIARLLIHFCDASDCWTSFFKLARLMVADESKRAASVSQIYSIISFVLTV